MEFKEYQEDAKKTAIYAGVLNKDYAYLVLGMVGETGEVAEKIKKILRDKQGIITEHDQTELRKELGDVLWYLSNLATELGLSMDDIAKLNIEKVMSRKERNVIHGQGDNR
jgi:NTP pyrophosphatase (non-canonical NTP hydrolase)